MQLSTKNRFFDVLNHAMHFQKITQTPDEVAESTQRKSPKMLTEEVWQRYVRSLQSRIDAEQFSTNPIDLHANPKPIFQCARLQRSQTRFTVWNMRLSFQWSIANVLKHPLKAVDALLIKGLLVHAVVKPATYWIANPIYRLALRYLISNESLKTELANQQLLKERQKKRAFLANLFEQLAILHVQGPLDISLEERSTIIKTLQIAKNYDLANFPVKVFKQ